MNSEDVSFQNMTQKLLEALPELTSYHDRALAASENDGEWSGQHIAYEEVMSKAIKEMLRAGPPGPPGVPAPAATVTGFRVEAAAPAPTPLA